jgi:AMMECR1 domain-containing protein
LPRKAKKALLCLSPSHHIPTRLAVAELLATLHLRANAPTTGWKEPDCDYETFQARL